ncbi:hypothetical protein BCR37DRAFT_165713 [Protomyces lactucae-debilis]|uniref:Uncharacterized protein n=1 Tax=Protomyces lactucae-debilis TaxID=2754530 RepID=A0A1Y2EXS9_PROLT|nr:uncharacterized protein BCR37DRAFT_165713 [Protomyces lactucae-debilis]ORY76380.1 hypothetical protein BCR37DRAFT_165713 [Protomyces lactucae-debilis]
MQSSLLLSATFLASHLPHVAGQWAFKGQICWLQIKDEFLHPKHPKPTQCPLTMKCGNTPTTIPATDSFNRLPGTCVYILNWSRESGLQCAPSFFTSTTDHNKGILCFMGSTTDPAGYYGYQNLATYMKQGFWTPDTSRFPDKSCVVTFWNKAIHYDQDLITYEWQTEKCQPI